MRNARMLGCSSDAGGTNAWMPECYMDGADAQVKTNQSHIHDMEVGKNRIDASRIGEGGRERKF